MDATKNIATDLFYKIRSRFQGLKLGAETGQITINPEDARFFDFDYTESGNAIGHVSISLAEPNSMKVYFSTGITEGMDGGQKDNWYGFLRELRSFAKRRLLAFDTRDITKDNLDKRDYEFLSQHAKPTPADNNTILKPVGESVMNEGNLYGTKTLSYQKLEDTRLVIKHSKSLTDDQVPGARSRNISALFIENSAGERFKYPFVHLAGARAMQRHVANGGLPYDEIGESIIKMSEEIAQLKSFSNYVVRNDLMNSDTNAVVERGTAQLENLRNQVYKLSKQRYYEEYKENFEATQGFDVPDDVMEDFKEKFTVKNFNENIAEVFPVLYRLMQAEDKKLGYDDIVAMTTKEEAVSEEADTHVDPMAKFEDWAMMLGETSPIQSDDEEEKQTAVEKLNALVGEHFPPGVDGMNAIEALDGIIDDPALEADIKKKAKQDPDGCIRPLIKAWIEENAPEVLDSLDFGDMVDEPAVGADEIEPPREDFTNEDMFNAIQELHTEAGIELDEGVWDKIKSFFTGSNKSDDDGSEDNMDDKANTGDIEPGKSYKPGAVAYAAPRDKSDIKTYDLDPSDDELKAKYAAQDKARDFAKGFTDKVTNIKDIISKGADHVMGMIPQDIKDKYSDFYGTLGSELSRRLRKPFSADKGADNPYSSQNFYKDKPEYQKIDQTGYKGISKQRSNLKIKDKLDKMGIQTQSYDSEGSEQEGMSTQKLAEFIFSFYDKESGTFPKGPEGVCTMVGKKFGEQAEAVARKMVERMAPVQDQGAEYVEASAQQENEELKRIKSLSGL